jgi:hypothetical protein
MWTEEEKATRAQENKRSDSREILAARPLAFLSAP